MLKHDYTMSRKQAIAEGFIIDSHCYPNFAYKGARFAPNEGFPVPTEIEDPLIEFGLQLKKVTEALAAFWDAIGNELKPITEELEKEQ